MSEVDPIIATCNTLHHDHSREDNSVMYRVSLNLVIPDNNDPTDTA